MPLYMSTFDYEPQVWAELVSNPENRTETVAGCRGRRLQAEGPLVCLPSQRRLRGDPGAGPGHQKCQHRDRDQRERSVPQVRDDRPVDPGRAARGAEGAGRRIRGAPRSRSRVTDPVAGAGSCQVQLPRGHSKPQSAAVETPRTLRNTLSSPSSKLGSGSCDGRTAENRTLGHRPRTRPTSGSGGRALAELVRVPQLKRA